MSILSAHPETAKALAAKIEQEIVAGVLEPGDRLATVRARSEALGIAANTVSAAYQILSRRGLIEGRGRLGTFVSEPSLPDRQLASPVVQPGLVNLTDGNPDLRLVPDLDDPLRRVADEGRSLQIGYGEPQVLPDLRECFERQFAADGVDAEHLAVVGGALDGIERVLIANTRHGDRVGVEDPGYQPVRSLLAALGLRPVPLTIDGSGVVPDALAGSLASGLAAVILTPRAQNPTGSAHTEQRSLALGAALAERPEVLVIEDDHASLVAGADLWPIGGAAGGQNQGRVHRWAMIRSMAKALGPDIRLAAVAGDRATIERVSSRIAVGVGWVPQVMQRLVVAVLESASPGFATASAAYRRRRIGFAEAFTSSGPQSVQAPPSGLNLWVPVGDEAATVAGMERRGFAIAPGSRFRVTTSPGVRVSIANTDDNVAIAAGMALAETLAAMPAARTVRTA